MSAKFQSIILLSAFCATVSISTRAMASDDATALSGRSAAIREEGFANETPKQLEGIGITEHLGAELDLDLPFVDQNGQSVTLRNYFKDGKPVLLSLAYYTCPSLCNFHMNGVLDGLKQLKWTLGDQFHYVVVSIDSREGPEVAAKKRQNYLNAYGRVGAESGWHFLTGKEENIRKLADRVGFQYRWDENEQQFAHASAAIVITPLGKISRYLRGIVFPPQTLRLALLEASNGQVGTIIDNLVLFCFHFDSKAGKYSLAIMNIVRGLGAVFVAAFAMMILPYWIRQRRVAKHLQGEV